MIDIGSENLVPLARIARSFPAPDSRRGINVSVLHRWARTGVNGVRLEVVRKDGCVCTSYEALGRFLENVVAKLEHGEGVPPLRWHDDAVRGMLARFNADPKHVAHRCRARRRFCSAPAKASREASKPTASVRADAPSPDSGGTSDGGTQSQASS